MFLDPETFSQRSVCHLPPRHEAQASVLISGPDAAFRIHVAKCSEGRIRATYQHACLCFMTGRKMTNATLRERFGIEEHNAAKASRIIADAVAAGRIKPFDPEQAKKYPSYVPFWA